MVPRGHTVRQNGRIDAIIHNKKMTSNPIFQVNSHPVSWRKKELAATKGIPASRVPAGQIHLQNQV